MSGLVERKYLLLKRGLYYAPDNAGYTGVKEQAGRYLQSDASPDSGVTAIHEDEAFDFSPATHPETKVKYLRARITALEAENERMKLEVEKHEALNDSAYYAGMKVGWNFCVADDVEGYNRARESTEHIAELRRIREARQALGGPHDAD